jgi:hypothetical protein
LSVRTWEFKSPRPHQSNQILRPPMRPIPSLDRDDWQPCGYREKPFGQMNRSRNLRLRPQLELDPSPAARGASRGRHRSRARVSIPPRAALAFLASPRGSPARSRGRPQRCSGSQGTGVAESSFLAYTGFAGHRRGHSQERYYWLMQFVRGPSCVQFVITGRM